MKKIFLLMVLMMSIALAGCSKTTYYANGVPTYYLEPENYVIVNIKILDRTFLGGGSAYGYISNEEYYEYLNGSLTGVLVVKHPYEEERSVAVPVSNIEYIEVGRYKDYR